MKAKIIKSAVTAGVICTGLLAGIKLAGADAIFRNNMKAAEIKDNTVVFPEDEDGETEYEKEEEISKWNKDEDSDKKVDTDNLTDNSYLFENDSTDGSTGEEDVLYSDESTAVSNSADGNEDNGNEGGEAKSEDRDSLLSAIPTANRRDSLNGRKIKRVKTSDKSDSSAKKSSDSDGEDDSDTNRDGSGNDGFIDNKPRSYPRKAKPKKKTADSDSGENKQASSADSESSDLSNGHSEENGENAERDESVSNNNNGETNSSAESGNSNQYANTDTENPTSVPTNTDTPTEDGRGDTEIDTPIVPDVSDNDSDSSADSEDNSGDNSEDGSVQPIINEPVQPFPQDYYINDWIDPGEKPVFPTEGIEEDSDGDEIIELTDSDFYIFTDVYWNTDALSKIYMGQTITPTTLLYSSYFYIDVNGVRYRLTEFGENFKIDVCPETADEENLVDADFWDDGFSGKGFCVTYSARANSNSPWVTKTVKYQVYPYMILLADENNVSALGSYYLTDGETLSLSEKQGSFFDSEYTDYLDPKPLDELFLGWSETANGEYVGSEYVPKNTGRTVLYSLGKQSLSDEYTAYLKSQINFDTWGYEYIQTLTDYSGDDTRLVIPDGIQSVDFDETHSFDTVYISEYTEEINTDTLVVNSAFEVSENSRTYSAVDGILYSKDGKKLIAVPCEKTQISLSAEVTEMIVPSLNNIERIRVNSDSLTISGIENLKNTDIVVPDEYYGYYYSVWGDTLSENGCRLVTVSGETPDLKIKDGIMMSGDETVVYKVLSGTGTLFIPDSVTEMADGAVDENSGYGRIILPCGLKKIDSGAFSNTDAEIYFTSESLPEVQDGAFDGESHVYLPESAADGAETLGTDYTLMTVGVSECDGFYYMKPQNGEITLLKAPESVVHFDGTLPNGVKIGAVGSWAFSGCDSLTLCELPENVGYIGSYAFDGVRKMGFFSAATGSFTVADEAFENCTVRFAAFNSLDITFENGYAPYLDGCAYATGNADEDMYPYTFRYYGDEYYLVEQGGGKYLVGTLGDGLVQILGATSDSSGSVTVGSDVLCISSGAFEDCTEITDVYIDGSNMTYAIAESAFSGCTSLSSVTFGENAVVTGIESFAFYDTAITQITLPKNILSIGTNVFGSCEQLKTVTFTGSVPPKLAIYYYGFPFKFGDDLDVQPTAVLSGDAVGHEEDYISCWKYPLVGKDSTVDDISADEELEAVNAARQMLGLSPLETLGENDDTDNSDIGDNIDNSDNIDNIDNSDNAE